MKKCLLILGMHRSGTSLLTGLLHYSGISAGKSFLEPLEENPKGFFEVSKIYELNEEILRAAGTQWNVLKNLDFQNIEVARFKEEIKKTIVKEFEGEEIFALKDPRICLLLPIYVEVFSELHVKVLPIVVRRNYVEIARSLKIRNNYSLLNGYSLSKFYYQMLKKNLSSSQTLEITYEELLSNTKETIFKLWDNTGVSQKFFNKEMEVFVDSRLRRSKISYARELIVTVFGEMKFLYFKFKMRLC